MNPGVRFESAVEVGVEIRRIREAAGWTQLDLATALIVDPTDRARAENKRTELSNWENGKVEPRGGTVLNILAILGALREPPPGTGGLAETVEALVDRLDAATALLRQQLEGQ